MKNFFVAFALMLGGLLLSTSLIAQTPIVPSGWDVNDCPSYAQGYSVGANLAVEYHSPHRRWSYVWANTSIISNTYTNALLYGCTDYAAGVLDGFRTTYTAPTWQNNDPDNGDGGHPANIPDDGCHYWDPVSQSYIEC